MKIALYGHTHGIGWRNETDQFARSIPATSMRPVEVAQAAERAGFHSMWFPDHVCMPIESTSGHVANESRTRAYEPRHNMLDGAVVMGAVATATTHLKLGTSVLIAPYRGPLNDARQLATVDVLSGGRLIAGVGAGWMEEEFRALGLPYEHRAQMTEEAIEIWKRAWTDDVVSFEGKHYRFANVSMDPKPVQKPRPPIVYGTVVAAGARRAARHADGLYPLFLDPKADPFRFGVLQDAVRKELAAEGRDPSSFHVIAGASMRITAAGVPGKERPICTGAPEQVLEDLRRFANAGYSMVVALFDCPSGTVDELLEQIDRAGHDVIPAAAGIAADGGWKPLD
jgi:probable F420-dependent oxidoreductase